MFACLCDVVLLSQLPVCEGEDDLLLLLRLVVQVPAAQHQSCLNLPTSLTQSSSVLSCLPVLLSPAQSYPAYRSYSVQLSLILPRHQSWRIQHRLYPAGTSISWSSLVLSMPSPGLPSTEQFHPAYHQACLPVSLSLTKSYSVLLSLILPRHQSWRIQHRLPCWHQFLAGPV
jgi:hypothetical protein